jgi:hypothetical protein
LKSLLPHRQGSAVGRRAAAGAEEWINLDAVADEVTGHRLFGLQDQASNRRLSWPGQSATPIKGEEVSMLALTCPSTSDTAPSPGKSEVGII